jgi:hypothetical protein
MPKTTKCAIAVVFCWVLIGCDQASLMKRWTPPEDEAAARGFFDLLRQRKFDQITRDLDASLAGPTIQDTFAQMAAIFPPETPESVKVVGSHVFRGQSYSITSLTLEYQFPGKWLLVDFTTKRTADAMTIIGFHVRPLSDSLENMNKFTLVGKSAIHYEMLALAVCSLGFSLYVLIVCTRAKNVKKKWLWALLALVGVGTLAIDWTTGELTFAILAVHIPGATMGRTFYGPWTLVVHFPLGATWFLVRQRKNRIAPQSSIPPAELSQ